VRRFLTISAGTHVLVLVVAFAFSTHGPRQRPLPPVYSVNLVSAAEAAPRVSRPEPSPPEPVEEKVVPEPEAVEKVPDPEKKPPKEPTKTPPKAPTKEPAKKAPAKEPTPSPGPERGHETGPDMPITTEGRPFEFPWYLDALVKKVQRNWRAPGSNARKTTIYFRIDRSGRLHDVRVAESSGNFLFDQAAQRAVEASDPMPPLPGAYTGDFLGVYFDFDTQVHPS